MRFSPLSKAGFHLADEPWSRKAEQFAQDHSRKRQSWDGTNHSLTFFAHFHHHSHHPALSNFPVSFTRNALGLSFILCEVPSPTPAWVLDTENERGKERGRLGTHCRLCQQSSLFASPASGAYSELLTTFGAPCGDCTGAPSLIFPLYSAAPHPLP